jgi:hypothetical protein
MLSKILKKILEIDWDTTNPNKIIRACKNITQNFKN